MSCAHQEFEPVELSLQGEVIELLGQMCVRCFAVLPPSWGCPECEWLVAETLCGDRDYFLASPCAGHMEVCS